MATENYPDRARLVDNVALRRAVAAFASQPNQRGSLEVLRLCMYGEVLFDITGSDAFAGEPFAAGSRLQIRGGTGPNGGSALFVFTRNEEISRLYPPGTATQSLAQPATGGLELARSQGNAWLYIDPLSANLS
ncbi:MAG: SseB family protein [Actinomycetota bacterium]|nr:SseB family protein [Actinomycetota bacterium]